MGILEGLFGGGGSSDSYDLYGDLLTDKQRAALRDQQMGQGLLRMAGAFADAGMPSRMPIPFGSAIGKAAQALGGNQDEALKGIMTAAQIRELQAKAKIREQMFGPEANAKMDALFAALSGGDTRAPAAPLPPRIPTGGGPTAGPPASNAPPPPPVALTPDADLMGGYGGGPPAMPAAGSAGLLPPPAATQLGNSLPGQGVLASLMMNGGGAPGGSPFGPSAARPGAAGPDRPIDIEQLSGEAAPVDAGRQGRVDFWRSQGAPEHVAQGIADRVKAESGFNPSVMGDSGTSGGLYQHHADRLSRLKGFAASQGRPWTDPGVQDQFAATEVQGGDAIAAKGWPAILAAPDRQTASTLWDKYFERSKYGPGSGGPDVVIPSGRGVSSSTLRTVADTGAATGGMPPLPGLPGAGGVPGAAGGNPAMNALLLELARRNAAAETLGMGNPYGSMLQVLQGTPQYKAMIESATRAAGLPFRREEASETAAGEQPYKLQGIQYQGQVNAAVKNLEQLGAAGLDLADIPVPDGKGGTVVRQGTRAQGVMVAHGFDVPEIGFKGIHGPMPGAPAAQAAGGAGDAGGVPLAGKEQISEAQKARIGIDAQLAKEVGDQALQARRLLPLVDEALVLARKTPEGLAGPASAKIGQIAAAFGVAPTPGQSNAEVLGAINQRLIPLVREPGAQSNAEMDAYLASGPGLMLTADGRVKIAEMTKAIGQRAIAVAEVYRDTIGEPSSVRRAKLDALDKPLFTPEQRAAMETAGKPAAGVPAGLPAGTAPTGQFYQGKPVYKMPDGSLKVMQ